jgi:hypothetical protein
MMRTNQSVNRAGKVRGDVCRLPDCHGLRLADTGFDEGHDGISNVPLHQIIEMWRFELLAAMTSHNP